MKNTGSASTSLYDSIHDASEAAIQLGITNMEEYQAMRKMDARLPDNPKEFYKASWNAFGEEQGFLAQGKYAYRKLGLVIKKHIPSKTDE